MRLLLAALLALAWFAPAQAQAKDCTSGSDACTYSEAWQQCQSYIGGRPAWDGGLSYKFQCAVTTTYIVMAQAKINDAPQWGNEFAFYFVNGVNCPSGQENVPEGGCRCPGGYKFDPFNPSECMNDGKCRALNSGLGGAERTMTGSSFCPAVGCQMRVNETTATKRNGQGGSLVSGMFEYTGESCGKSAENPEPAPDKLKPDPPPQECVTYSSGQTFCQKRDGQQCYTTSNGRQNCWNPGETGEKTDGPVLQKRNAGPTEVPPQNLQLPSGDSLQKSGQSVTDTTTKGGTTITTTTTNYMTTNGTNASGGGTGKDSGEKGDGTGASGEGDDKGSASGGGDCDTPPITTGDPVIGMVATQAWHTRCAVEAGNAAKVTGDVANCAQPFTVEGTHANAVQLRAMRAQLCKGDANGDGQPDWTKPDGTEAGDGGEDDQPGVLQRMVNTDMLDKGGFFGGSGTCPQLGTLELGPFGSFSLDSQPWFCDLVALMRGVVLLMGAFISLRILTGEGL